MDTSKKDRKHKNVVRNTYKSFNAAFTGLFLLMRTQRNMRYHFIAAFFVILLSVILNVDRIELMILIIVISLVLVTEMVNTAIENIVNIVKAKYHPLAKLIKDISAAAVLVSAFCAFITGYIILSKKMPLDIKAGILRLKNIPMHLAFLSLVTVFALVIAGKLIFHKGTPLRGGMPSGHAALAFSMWTIVVLLTKDVVVFILVFLMALLIAGSRMYRKVHNFWEVFAGSVLGIIITLLIFQMFWRS